MRNNNYQLANSDAPRCEEVIICNLERRGKGIEHDPVRQITQVYSKDGVLIAENDPAPTTFSLTDMVSFSRYCAKNGIANPSNIDKENVYNWLDEINKRK